MKLISLNTWGGVVFTPLIDFINQNKDTDIFCFQEIYKSSSGVDQLGNIRPNLLSDLTNILTGYQVFFYSVIKGYDLDGEYSKKVELDLEFGMAILVKDSLSVTSSGQGEIFDDHTGILAPDFSNLPVYYQHIDFEDKNKSITVCNFHGMPKPANKLDSSERIKQSRITLDFLQTKKGAKILTGDFNLLPETESMQMINKEMTSLITKYGIEITRSRLSPYFGKADFQKFADYTFVSEDIEVHDFQVPDLAISDHLPMILYFS